jgi:hypothetical protein
MDCGHEISSQSGAVWGKLADDLSQTCDGCLILEADDEQWRLARMLHERGLPLWNTWRHIPPTKEWPNGGKLDTWFRDRGAEKIGTMNDPGETTDLMPLMQALDILAHIHTRGDPEVGFVVVMGATPDPLTPGPPGSYTEAWRSVRHALGDSR